MNNEELIKHVIDFTCELISDWNDWGFNIDTKYAAEFKAEILELYNRCGGDIKVYLAKEKKGESWQSIGSDNWAQIMAEAWCGTKGNKDD